MSIKKPTPSYNLGAITRETGLNADTLRAWERRYNLPQPNRSAGGQRLYSHRDLETVKWLIARQEEGLRISQATELWHILTRDGIDPLDESKEQTMLPSIQGENITAYRSQWVSACLSFNETEAEQLVSGAFSQYPPETVCFDLLFSGLSEIGEAWYRGEVSVQQEHFASALVSRRLNALIAGAPIPFHPGRIVIAAPPEEEHTLSSLMITFLLRRRGWDVVYLGANVPLDNFRVNIEALQPDMIILTAHQLFTAATLLDLINEIVELPITLAIGGLIFNQISHLDKIIPGHFLGEDLREVVPKIEQLLRNPGGSHEITIQKPLPLVQKFQSMLPAIEYRVSEWISGDSDIPSTISWYLSRDILAALKLGDISILSSNIEWIQGKLSNIKMPGYALLNFLQVYYQIVDEILGSNGAVLLNWLQDEIDQLDGS